MSGNVWEWVWDRYDSYPNGAFKDPSGAVSGASRVVRGGSWGNDAQYLRSAHRLSNVPSLRGDFIGFRVARR